MKIVVKKQPEVGAPISEVPFGTVVRRASGDDGKTFYLVASTQDGTGHRALVTLGGGSWKYTEQTLRVIPVDAHVVIGEAEPKPLRPSYMSALLDDWADATEGKREVTFMDYEVTGLTTLLRNAATALRMV